MSRKQQIGVAESLIENEIGCGRFQIGIVFFIFILIKMVSLFTIFFMSFGSYNPGWRCIDNVSNTNSSSFIQNINNHSIRGAEREQKRGNLNFTNLKNAHNWNNLTSRQRAIPEAVQMPHNSFKNISSDYLPVLFSNITTRQADIQGNQYILEEKFCPDFEKCQHVEFNPDSSTIVTEWHLICSKSWVGPLIIAIQFTGLLIGSVFAGQIADAVGRKPALYFSVFLNILLSIGAIFSTEWEIFAAISFFIGVACAFFESMNYTYPAEFLPQKWRGPLVGLPAWGLSGIIFGAISMFLRNWKYVLAVRAVICVVSLLPALLVPESLRWLEAKHRDEDFKLVAHKMARCNGIHLHEIKTESVSMNSSIEVDTRNGGKTKQYNVFDLFRPGYRGTTIIISFVWLSFNLIYYTVNFGIRAFSGDFYINTIIMFAIMTPFTLLPVVAPNVLGRKKSAIVFMMSAAVCLITATIFERFTFGDLKSLATLIFVIVANASVDTTWCIQQVHVIELYPTVVRGIAINWAGLMSRIGGIIAPFLIPNDPSNLFIWYLLLASISVVCCIFLTRLRETKGQPLRETF